MRITLTLLAIYCHILLSSGSGSTNNGDDRRWFVSLVDLVELDYEDHCEQRATATWDELTGAYKGLATKVSKDYLENHQHYHNPAYIRPTAVHRLCLTIRGLVLYLPRNPSIDWEHHKHQ